MSIIYKTDLVDVNWPEMKATLVADDFDNGRSPGQLQLSFENSAASCLAYHNGRIVGTVRALSDGVGNAYIVDVWTLSAYRQQGIARQMMDRVMEQLPGQHIFLFTDEDVVDFYKKLGFQKQGIGLALVKGKWLNNDSADYKSSS